VNYLDFLNVSRRELLGHARLYYDIYVFSFCFMVIYVKRHKLGKSYFLLIGYHNFHFLDVF
jgi:hypothetical protein